MENPLIFLLYVCDSYGFKNENEGENYWKAYEFRKPTFFDKETAWHLYIIGNCKL